MVRAIGLLASGLIAVGCSSSVKHSAHTIATPTGGVTRVQANPADDLIRRVHAAYQNTPQLTAEFRQLAFNKTFGVSLVSDGKVYFKQPDRMRLDYFSRRSANRKQVARSQIVNGPTVWAVDRRGKWYYSQPLSKGVLPIAVPFLRTDDLLRKFDAKLVTGSKYGASGDKVVELTPKRPARLRSLLLVVDASDFRIKKSIVTNADGDINELSFYESDATAGVADTWFVFNPEAAQANGFREIGARVPAPRLP